MEDGTRGLSAEIVFSLTGGWEEGERHPEPLLILVYLILIIFTSLRESGSGRESERAFGKIHRHGGLSARVVDALH
jgi:hypothetical protein